jgi:hypothetical protein
MRSALECEDDVFDDRVGEALDDASALARLRGCAGESGRVRLHALRRRAGTCPGSLVLDTPWRPSRWRALRYPGRVSSCCPGSIRV